MPTYTVAPLLFVDSVPVFISCSHAETNRSRPLLSQAGSLPQLLQLVRPAATEVVRRKRSSLAACATRCRLTVTHAGLAQYLTVTRRSQWPKPGDAALHRVVLTRLGATGNEQGCERRLRRSPGSNQPRASIPLSNITAGVTVAAAQSPAQRRMPEVRGCEDGCESRASVRDRRPQR